MRRGGMGVDFLPLRADETVAGVAFGGFWVWGETNVINNFFDFEKMVQRYT